MKSGIVGERDGYAEVFRLLDRAGIPPADVARSLAGAVGFRNVLVHGYADVGDRLVVGNLTQLPASLTLLFAAGGACAADKSFPAAVVALLAAVVRSAQPSGAQTPATPFGAHRSPRSPAPG